MTPAERTVLQLAGDVSTGRATLAWAVGRARRLHPAAPRFLHLILHQLEYEFTDEERTEA